jgi:hypothetical protein
MNQEASNVESTPAVAVQRVVSRPHPWKSNFINWAKVKADKAEYRRRQSKKRRDDGIEYFRETEKAWHRTHPNGANTGNPKFTERAIKANAAKSANARTHTRRTKRR